MALHFNLKPVEAPMTPQTEKKGFSWEAWYEKNKKRLAEKKALRYQQDEAYRKAALERSAKQRKNKEVVDPGEFTISFQQASEQLGVSIWVMREWRKKNYFPEPKHRQGKLWFSSAQINLLGRLAKFFEVHGVRTSAENQGELEGLIQLVYANW